jgi:cupin 2 domain-containing protein
MKVKNLFLGVPETPTEELFESLIETGRVRIERIVSAGHASRREYWYDQEQDEWVMVLKGSAGLRFEGCAEVVVMKPGDWINIPAHKKHRVEWTDPEEKTIWLAIHY